MVTELMIYIIHACTTTASQLRLAFPCGHLNFNASLFSRSIELIMLHGFCR